MDNEINSIKIVEADFKLRLNKRVVLLAERPKEKTKDLVQTIATAVENLFKAIEVAPIMSAEEDHTALAQELSQLSDMFNRSIAIRSANNQRKADKDKEGEEGGEEGTEGTNNSSEPMVTAMHAGIGWNNDWESDEEELINPFEDDEISVNKTDAEKLHSKEDVDDEDGAVAVE